MNILAKLDSVTCYSSYLIYIIHINILINDRLPLKLTHKHIALEYYILRSTTYLVLYISIQVA